MECLEQANITEEWSSASDRFVMGMQSFVLIIAVVLYCLLLKFMDWNYMSNCILIQDASGNHTLH